MLQESCYPYWDQSGPTRYDEFIVEVKLVTQETGFVRRDLKLSDNVSASIKKKIPVL